MRWLLVNQAGRNKQRGERSKRNTMWKGPEEGRFYKLISFLQLNTMRSVEFPSLSGNWGSKREKSTNICWSSYCMLSPAPDKQHAWYHLILTPISCGCYYAHFPDEQTGSEMQIDLPRSQRDGIGTRTKVFSFQCFHWTLIPLFTTSIFIYWVSIMCQGLG